MASTSDFLSAAITQIADGDKGDLSIIGGLWKVDADALIPCLVAPAAFNISAYRALTLNSTGQAIYASSDTLAHMNKVIGISIATAIAGSPISIYNHEVVFNASWTWAEGGAIYLGNNGLLTQVPPASPDAFMLKLGSALSPQLAEIEVQMALKLVQ